MMSLHSKKKERALRLRLNGKSYGEILKILDLSSKGTLSYWFRGLKLTTEAKMRLKQKIDIAKEKGLFRFNRERTKAIQLENQKVRKLARIEIPKLTPATLLLVGAALYWGEGLQNANFKVSGISFVNSNHYMVALFLRFLREVLKIKDERIKAHIRIHPNINEGLAIRFWQKVTRLPPDRFRITYQISRASQLKRPVRSLPYGTLDIRVNQRVLFFKLKGYIEGLASQTKI